MCVVHVDNAHLDDNYMALARDAYSSDNKEAVEAYCNKIIEIDPGDFEVCMLKGKAVGYQTTLDKSRFREAATCFTNTINSLLSGPGKNDVEEEIDE